MLQLAGMPCRHRRRFTRAACGVGQVCAVDERRSHPSLLSPSHNFPALPLFVLISSFSLPPLPSYIYSFTVLLESFNALKSACNMDASTESLPLESLTGHEDFFAAESPYALPLLSAAAVVRFSKKAFRFFRVARWFSRNLAYACMHTYS